jgi:hypothetical protein
MRANPIKLREEFKQKLTLDEQLTLGVDLSAGSDHYRAYVGPPFNYDINGGLQFQFMLDLGLREYHRFLEIGCGSLRLGRLLMMYLLPSRYHGVEPNQKILKEGLEYNLGSSDEDNHFINLKKPKFSNNADFDFTFVGEKVDFVIAQSIASHTGVSETEKLFSNISNVINDTGVAMVTYIRCANPELNNTQDGWFYPDCITYTDEHMAQVASKFGFIANRTSWPLLNRRPDGLITSQTPLILTRKPWKPTLAQYFAGLSIEPICEITESINSTSLNH